MNKPVAGGVGDREHSSRRRAFIPPEAGGLLAAVATARAGDDSLLQRWDREARPIIMRALRRAGFDPASADDAVMHLLERAECALRSRRNILREVQWMSAVLTSARREQRRSAQRAQAAKQRLAERATPWCETLHGEEDREELLAAAAQLRPRFAMAIRLRLRGLDAREAHVALSVEFALGPERARKIDRQALALLRAVLAHRDA